MSLSHCLFQISQWFFIKSTSYQTNFKWKSILINGSFFILDDFTGTWYAKECLIILDLLWFAQKWPKLGFKKICTYSPRKCKSLLLKCFESHKKSRWKRRVRERSGRRKKYYLDLPICKATALDWVWMSFNSFWTKDFISVILKLAAAVS